MKKFKSFYTTALALVMTSAIIMTGCTSSKSDSKKKATTSTEESSEKETEQETTERVLETYDEPELTGTEVPLNIQTEENVIDDKYRNYYEIFVASFCDSDGDGMGDIQGLISKLDYINDGDPTTDDDLGYNAIWLMPIHPSASYHKYDVMDYQDIDEAYGTLDDYKQLVEECHKRGIDLIIDLVMNHSSVAHPWFKEAKTYLQNLPEGQQPNAADCKYVDYYTFTTEQVNNKYYPVGSSSYYYDGEFSQMMPDLNLDNPDVRAEFEQIAKFWLDLGTDGFRLDAVKEYYSGDTDHNVDVLTWFNGYVKGVNPDAYIVGETWTGDNYEYVASGMDSAFDFLYSQNAGMIQMVVNEAYTGEFLADCYGDSVDMLEEINPNAIFASFIGNHDIDRVTAILGYNENKIKFAHGLMALMPGNIFEYYGDEIGTGGSGADENKRSAMRWVADEDAEGMTTGPSGMQKDYVINKFGSVEEQLADEGSILNYVKKTIKLRNVFPEISRGDIDLTIQDDIEDEAIFATIRKYNDSSIIVLANTSSEEFKTVTLPRDKYGYTDIEGVVTIGEQQPYQYDDTIALPPQSIVVLK